MAWCLLSSNSLVVPVMTYGQWGSQEQISMIFWSKHSEFNSIKFTSKMSSSYRRPLCWGISMSKGTAWSYLPPDPELNPDGGISFHFNDVIMSAMAFQITSIMIVYSTVYSGADQRKHQSSASLIFVRGIHGWPVNSPHKGPVTRKMFPFDIVTRPGLSLSNLTNIR